MAESITVDGFSHINPIPAAARVGPMVWSSLVPPLIPGTKDVPEDLGDQFRTILANMASVLEAADIGWEHVGKIDIWLRDPTSRGALNEAWLEQFPDEKRRPARQVHDGSTTIPPNAGIVATFQAYDG